MSDNPVKLPGQIDEAGSVKRSFVDMRGVMPTIRNAASSAPPSEIGGRTVQHMQEGACAS